MEREKRDLYDGNSKVTNMTYFKGDKVPEGYYPMVVMVCIQNSSDKFLMQRRSVSKGGDWGVTGGHVNFEESPDVVTFNSDDKTLKTALHNFKKKYVIQILDEVSWNQTEAAKIMDIQRTYLSKLMSELDIRR